jgi:dTDP-4-dehydrorhamnose 3,5-epimerase
MKLINTKIKGLKLIKSQIYKDKRGYLRETFNNKLIKKNFVFDVMSFSKKGVLRGLHIQTIKPQAKIITVTHGKILDVVVDLRKKSKSFGKYFSIIISDKSDFSFYIPEGFAHGFFCISKKCTVNYKCSEYRNPKSETTLQWNDESVAVKWPIKKPLLSEKDKNGKNLNFFKI